MIPIHEQPCPLPDGRQWVHLGDVTKNQYDYTAKALKNNALPKMLRIIDIQDGAVNWHEVPNCEINDEQKKKYLLQDNDIFIARRTVCRPGRGEGTGSSSHRRLETETRNYPSQSFYRRTFTALARRTRQKTRGCW